MNKKTVGGAKKTTQKKKGQKKEEDRNWIRPPNSITNKNKANTIKLGKNSKKNSSKSPSKISYWVDKDGEVQLYTPEQLAKCNILMNINVLLNKSLILIENLQKMDDDTTVGTLKQQEYAQFETSEPSVYTHFMKLMAATSDITFAEFLNFISEGDDVKAFSKLGKEKLKKVIKDDSPEVVKFFTSDRLKGVKGVLTMKSE